MIEAVNESLVLEGLYGTIAYAYFAIAFAVLFYWVWNSEIKYKFEIGIVGFYLMTGNINQMLTIKIPGFSLFEIQPERFILFAFAFFIARYVYLADKSRLQMKWTVPWFQIFLILFAVMMMLSQYLNLNAVGFADLVVNSMEVMNFIIILIVLRMIVDEAGLLLLGKALLFGAVVTSMISFIQLGIDPLFMRIGDHRLAFGELLRSNGFFSTEYFNAYFLIAAVAWTLVTVENVLFRYLLLAIFILGVFTTFQRMSWLILCLVLFIHFVFLERMAIQKLVLSGLVGLTMLISIGIMFNDDIRNSQLVQERLTERVDSRGGYYQMVLDNIWREPIWGFGGKNNEVYYYAMLQITRLRERATGEQGGIHNGYLASMFYYGIPACVLLIFFIISSVWYYSRLIKYHIFFAIPFLMAIIFMLSNLTNTLLFSSYLSILVAIHFGLGLGAKRLFLEENEEDYTTAFEKAIQEIQE